MEPRWPHSPPDYTTNPELLKSFPNLKGRRAAIIVLRVARSLAEALWYRVLADSSPPRGQISKILSSPIYKNILIFRRPKSALYPSPSPPKQKGRFAIVTNVGLGMRWTRMVLQTRAPLADGEVVWS